MKWIIAGNSPQPRDFGRKRSEDLYSYIKRLEEEKRLVKLKADKLMGELQDMHLEYARFAQETISTINRWLIEDEKRLSEAQSANLNVITEKLRLIAMKPGVR